MNQQKNNRPIELPEEWLTHARSDLKLAKIGNDQEVLPEQICFHAQQVVEKSLKAVLLKSQINFPFTHDLEELVEIIENSEIWLPPDLKDVGTLTPYAVETRYPGYWGEISGDDVSEAIEYAEKALKWAEDFIKKNGE